MPRKTTTPKATAKKSSVKKSVTPSPKTSSRSTKSVKPVEVPVQSPKTSSMLDKLPVQRKHLWVVVLIAVVLGLLFWLRGELIVAMVNNHPITRIHLIKELEKQYGKQVIDTLVTRKIIEQSAQKQNITISDQEIDEEIKSLEKRVSDTGQSLAELLAFQGMTQQELRENIRIQKVVEKLASKDVAVTDKEVDDYLAQSQPEVDPTTGEAPEPVSAEERAQIKESLTQQKQSEAIQKYLQEARNQAQIEYLNQSFKPQQ